MTKEIVLIVGLGEIGHTLFALLNEQEKSFSVYGLDLDEAKMQKLGQSRSRFPRSVDTLHICLPCGSQEKFLDAVTGYVEEFKPSLLIVNSTVPPGTTLRVAANGGACTTHHR